MVGIYDSGSGGLGSLMTLREIAPCADILYRGDLGNAPYGTKSREQLLPIIKQNIVELRERGCAHILVACMTASSLIPHLSEQERIGVYPITEYVGVSALQSTRSARVGIVSTSRTMQEGRLRTYLQSHGIFVSESEADALVPLAERGMTSPQHPQVRRIIAHATLPHKEARVDTLVLGCTHFPYFTEAFRQAMGEEVQLVSSSTAGAKGFFKQIPKEVLACQGRIQFI